jgi:hypothetical protein
MTLMQTVLCRHVWTFIVGKMKDEIERQDAAQRPA